MIETGFAKNHLHHFLITTFILVMLASGFNLVLYSQASESFSQLKKEQSNYQQLCQDLDRLNSKYGELEDRYKLLLEEKEKLEGELEKQNTSGGSISTAYLTIDDGPYLYTPQILQTLSEYKVPATFFVTGDNKSGDDDIYKIILEQGHALGNHTRTHNLNRIYRSKDAFMEDLLSMEDLLAEKTGVRPDIIRFPGGSSTTGMSTATFKAIVVELEKRGYDYFDWNVSTGDCNANLTAAQMAANVIKQAERQPGQDLVILMHSFNPASLEALPKIIEELKSRGYIFASLKKGAVNVKHR